MNKYFRVHACSTDKKWLNFIARQYLFLALLLGFMQTASALPFPLPSGYFVPAKQPMLQVYPRPDTETNSWARHHWAYYDGINSVEYRIPVGVSFGAWPYRFTCYSCPPGMSIGRNFGELNYGIVTWTPSAAITNTTVDILVEDQQLHPLHVTWTVSTSSSTSHFIFTDSVKGSDSGSATGAISAPFKTPTKSLSSAYATTINYFRGGMYVINNSVGTTASPMALLNYPGEAVTFDMSTGSLAGTGDVSDLFLQGITFNGGNASVGDYRTIPTGESSRQIFHALSFTNPVNGTVSGDNNTSIYFNAIPSYRHYIYIADSSEVGRAQGPGTNNTEALFVAFTTADSLFERNTVTSSGASSAMYLKASVYNTSLRANSISAATSSTTVVGSYDQINYSLADGNNEIAYNAINNKYAFGDVVAALTLNQNWGGPSTGHYWVYRNTVYGGLAVDNSTSTNGPFTFENNAVVVDTLNNTPPTGLTGVWAYKGWASSGNPSWTNASITDAGTQCEGATSSGYINTSTMQIAGTCRTNYLGKIGAEIFSPNVADLSLSTTAIQTGPGAALIHITASNAGPNDASSLTVSTVLPSGIALVTGSSSSNCAQSGQTITCTATTLANGASLVFNVAVSSSNTQPINLTFNASSNTADNINGNNSVAITAMPPTFLDILKVQQYLLFGSSLSLQDKQRLDVYPTNQSDGSITFSDLFLLQRMVLNN